MGHTDSTALAAFEQAAKPFDAFELARMIRTAPIRRDDELAEIVKAVATLANDYDAMPHNVKQWELCEMLDRAALLSEGVSA